MDGEKIHSPCYNGMELRKILPHHRIIHYMSPSWWLLTLTALSQEATSCTESRYTMEKIDFLCSLYVSWHLHLEEFRNNSHVKSKLLEIQYLLFLERTMYTFGCIVAWSVRLRIRSHRVTRPYLPLPSPKLRMDQSLMVLSLLALIKEFSLSRATRARMLLVCPSNVCSLICLKLNMESRSLSPIKEETIPGSSFSSQYHLHIHTFNVHISYTQ